MKMGNTHEEKKAREEIGPESPAPEGLRDIRDVRIKTELPKDERMRDYIRQIGNPYCFRHGKYTVKVSYADTDVTLEQRMLAYIRSRT